jgi:5-(carboxyamino)imidazole ribonucleotide synthase
MTVGVIGGGQLGRMLALAGYPLGLDFLFLDPSREAPAGKVAPVVHGAFTDPALLKWLSRECQVLTFDWENVSVEALRKDARGARRARISPPVSALATAQDRVAEKRLFERLGIPTTRWRAVGSQSTLERALRDVGVPGVLKTRRMGYDGKGQMRVRTPAEAQQAWQALRGVPLIYEEWVPFECEVSIIGARSIRGQTVFYPLNGNVHADGILRVTRAPYGPPRWHRTAVEHLTRCLEHFHYVGVLTIEFFVHNGRLIANEMAPRVHNSGHWTIEGCATSQFENHLRAILGWPLGSTRPTGHSAMINLIGEIPARERLLALEGLHLHDYGKEPRPARKLGHCTLVDRSADRRDTLARRVLGWVAPGVRLA